MFNKSLFFIILSLLIISACTARTGLDKAAGDNFAMFDGKSVDVVANHTSLDRKGRHIVDLLYTNEDLTLTAILAPEHGYRGDTERGEYIAAQSDPLTGVPVYSIYAKPVNQRPKCCKDSMC